MMKTMKKDAVESMNARLQERISTHYDGDFTHLDNIPENNQTMIECIEVMILRKSRPQQGPVGGPGAFNRTLLKVQIVQQGKWCPGEASPGCFLPC